MIVYVESNFILEIVLDQEQSSSAEALLALSENRSIQLVLPGFALTEPFSTITRRDRERRKLVNDISRTLTDLRRSSSYQDEATVVSNAIDGLAGIARREYASLHNVVERLLASARTVTLDSARFSQAIIYQNKYGLSPQDSIVYASVVNDLQMKPAADPKCFITRNSKDFDAPDIVAELGLYQCRLFFSFQEGLHYCAP